MPTYEYRCTKGHTFEVTESYTDEPLKKCQVCGAAGRARPARAGGPLQGQRLLQHRLRHTQAPARAEGLKRGVLVELELDNSSSDNSSSRAELRELDSDSSSKTSTDSKPAEKSSGGSDSGSSDSSKPSRGQGA